MELAATEEEEEEEAERAETGAGAESRTCDTTTSSTESMSILELLLLLLLLMLLFRWLFEAMAAMSNPELRTSSGMNEVKPKADSAVMGSTDVGAIAAAAAALVTLW
jgi:flagellar biogenesis protein FliO